MIFNQEFLSENSKCWPNELDVLGQASTLKEHIASQKQNGKIPGWSRTFPTSLFPSLTKERIQSIKEVLQLNASELLSTWGRQRLSLPSQ